MLDYNLPGCDIILVEHIIRTIPGQEWDGPGMIRKECWDMTALQAITEAATMTTKEEHAVAVRAFDRVRGIWLDTGEFAWKHLLRGQHET